MDICLFLKNDFYRFFLCGLALYIYFVLNYLAFCYVYKRGSFFDKNYVWKLSRVEEAAKKILFLVFGSVIFGLGWFFTVLGDVADSFKRWYWWKKPKQEDSDQDPDDDGVGDGG